MAITRNYALRLPASLKKAVEAVAREDGTTLNQFIVSAVAEKLSALETADYFAERAATSMPRSPYRGGVAESPRDRATRFRTDIGARSSDSNFNSSQTRGKAPVAAATPRPYRGVARLASRNHLRERNASSAMMPERVSPAARAWASKRFTTRRGSEMLTRSIESSSRDGLTVTTPNAQSR